MHSVGLHTYKNYQCVTPLQNWTLIMKCAPLMWDSGSIAEPWWSIFHYELNDFFPPLFSSYLYRFIPMFSPTYLPPSHRSTPHTPPPFLSVIMMASAGKMVRVHGEYFKCVYAHAQAQTKSHTLQTA